MKNVLVELLYEPSGEFENFTRMPLSDIEYLLCQNFTYYFKTRYSTKYKRY